MTIDVNIEVIPCHEDLPEVGLHVTGYVSTGLSLPCYLRQRHPAVCWIDIRDDEIIESRIVAWSRRNKLSRDDLKLLDPPAPMTAERAAVILAFPADFDSASCIAAVDFAGKLKSGGIR